MDIFSKHLIILSSSGSTRSDVLAVSAEKNQNNPIDRYYFINSYYNGDFKKRENVDFVQF